MVQKSMNRSFASWIHGLCAEDLPDSVVECCKGRILDSLASIVAGQHYSWTRMAVEMVKSQKGSASIIGYPYKVPAKDAAFTNAVMAHSIFQEDAFRVRGHPSVVIPPAALAVAEEIGARGLDLIVAVVAGYELMGRIPIIKMRRGFRAVPVAGPFGAAAAASKLMNLSEEQMVWALGYAANFAGGLDQKTGQGTMEAMFHAGMAARNGLTAATLAKLGATSAEDTLEGDLGFYVAFTGDNAHVQEVMAGLGHSFQIMNVIYKPYPVCQRLQLPIDLALTMRDRSEIEAEQIDRVVFYSEPTALPLGFAGPFNNYLQTTTSAPFSLAAVFLGKPVTDFGFYQEHYGDAMIASLAQKVEVVTEQNRSTNMPRIEVFLKSGKKLFIEEDNSHKLVPTKENMEAKARRLMSDFLGERVEEVIRIIQNLEKVDDVRDLTKLLTK